MAFQLHNIERAVPAFAKPSDQYYSSSANERDQSSPAMPALPETHTVALSEAPNQLVLKNVPLNKPTGTQVLVKVLACGVCASDISFLAGHFGPNFPRIQGHEIVGDVVATGDAVKLFSPGDRVGGAWHGAHDGSCKACQRGLHQMCDNQLVNGISKDGGFGEYALLNEEVVIRIPKDADPIETAPLMCAGVTVFNSIRKMHVEQGALVVIQGLGGLGHLGVQFARAMGYEVVAVSRGEDKRDFAKQLGAHHFIDSEKGDVVATIQKMGGAALIVTTAPNPAAISPMVDALGVAGKLLILAAVPNIEINTLHLLNRGASVHAWPSGHAIDSEEAVAFAHLHGIRCMVEKFPLKDIHKAFDHTRGGKVRFRSVVTVV